MVTVDAWSTMMSWWRFKSQRNWFERPKHHRKSRFFSFFIFPRDKSPSGLWACSDAAVQRCRCRIVPHAAVFPGALAWKERVERRVQRRQVRCKSTCGCNHVDLFLGHMCPPLCVFALFTDLTSLALPPPPPIDPLFHNVQRCVSSWNSRITWSGQVGICDRMDHHGGHDACYHYTKTHLMQLLSLFLAGFCGLCRLAYSQQDKMDQDDISTGNQLEVPGQCWVKLGVF